MGFFGFQLFIYFKQPRSEQWNAPVTLLLGDASPFSEHTNRIKEQNIPMKWRIKGMNMSHCICMLLNLYVNSNQINYDGNLKQNMFLTN